MSFSGAASRGPAAARGLVAEDRVLEDEQAHRRVAELLAALAAAGDLVALPRAGELRARPAQRVDQRLERGIADVARAVGAELRHEHAELRSQSVNMSSRRAGSMNVSQTWLRRRGATCSEVAEQRDGGVVPGQVVPAAPEDERRVGPEVLDQPAQRRRDALGGRLAGRRLLAAAEQDQVAALGRVRRSARASASSTSSEARTRDPARATCTRWRRPRRAARPPRGAGPACAAARRPAGRRPRLQARAPRAQEVRELARAAVDAVGGVAVGGGVILVYQDKRLSCTWIRSVAHCRRERNSPASSSARLDHDPALLLVVCLAQFMVILDVSIVNVALPSIHDDLRLLERAGLQWVVNAYTLTFAGFLMLGGRAADLLGRRRVFLVGTAALRACRRWPARSRTRAGCCSARARSRASAARSLSPATLSIVTSSFAEGPERNRALGVVGRDGRARRLLRRAARRRADPDARLARDLRRQRAARPAGRSCLGLRVIPADARPMADRATSTSPARRARHRRPRRADVRDRAHRHARLGRRRACSGRSPPASRCSRRSCSSRRASRATPLVPLSIFRHAQLRAANLVVVLLVRGAVRDVVLRDALPAAGAAATTRCSAGLAFLPMTLSIFAGSHARAAPRRAGSGRAT